MTATEIVIAENTSTEWRQFSDQLDCVPDPMTIRTAELFLNGKSGFAWSGLDTDTVWKAIDGNLHGLLTFFNMLMTRPAIPLIAYFETFHQQESMWTVASKSIVELLATAETGLLIPVRVEKAPYEQIRNAAREKLKELDLFAVSKERAEELAAELSAYGYDWKPDLGDVAVTDDCRPVAHFLLGGLIFGTYAKAASADHLIQSKRSGLFAALTKPGMTIDVAAHEPEEELFGSLKRTCVLSRDTVRVDELPAMPSVLADILLRLDRPVKKTSELLSRAIEVRQSPGGQAFQAWFSQLRSALGDGTYATSARRDIEKVQKEAEHRLKEDYPKWGMTFTPSISAGLSFSFKAKVPDTIETEAALSLGEAKLEGQPVRVGIPDWIRNWIVDSLPFGRHRKFLLRCALAQAEFQNISERLRKVWEDS
jgi:hypothetical protein